jgi:hypothetical protein
MRSRSSNNLFYGPLSIEGYEEIAKRIPRCMK